MDGALARADDPADLGAAIGRVVHDPDRWRQLGIAARNRYEEDFAPDIHRDRLTQAYREVARQGGR